MDRREAGRAGGGSIPSHTYQPEADKARELSFIKVRRAFSFELCMFFVLSLLIPFITMSPPSPFAPCIPLPRLVHFPAVARIIHLPGGQSLSYILSSMNAS